MNNISRRDFFAILGAGAAATALPGCCLPKCGPRHARAKIALQLYSLCQYIATKGSDKGIALERALNNVAAIGYKGVEFFGGGCFGHEAKAVRAMLADTGLKPCGIHVDNSQYGFNTKTWAFDPEVLKKTCDFNLAFGNNLIICPGGGNFPPGFSERTFRPSQAMDDHVKRLAEFYDRAAADAAKFGCRIGLHNHMCEHTVRLLDGTSFWDYFFSNTCAAVCMEQDVGWTTGAGVDAKEQYLKYPHRSPTLHAKENGVGKDVREFESVLGQPGRPGAVPVDWDGLIPVTERDGVEWYIVECSKHFEDLSAVLPSYNFLKSKGLGA